MLVDLIRVWDAINTAMKIQIFSVRNRDLRHVLSTLKKDKQIRVSVKQNLSLLLLIRKLAAS